MVVFDDNIIFDIAFKEIESLGHELVKAVRIEDQSYP
jgi:hypothetical protein